MPEAPDLDYIRGELDRQIEAFDVDFPKPLPTDKYIAVSALQKAIRRGDVLTAYRAAATVHLLDRQSFWRRTLVTAYEDIGVGDLLAVSQTTAAAERANWRARHGDFRVGLLVVDKLARVAKCRATDLLYGAARSLPAMAEHAAELAEADTHVLLDLVSDEDAPIVLRTLAAMYAAGTREESNTNIRQRVGCSAIWWRYQVMGLPQSLIDASQVAHRKLALPLPVILPLIQSLQAGPALVENVALADATSVNGIPLYALDGHTRLGRTAIREWRKVSERLCQYPLGAVRVGVFYIDSAPITPVYRWQLTAELDRLGLEGDMAREGVTGEAVFDLLGACKNELAALNDIRARMLTDTPSPLPLDLFTSAGR